MSSSHSPNDRKTLNRRSLLGSALGATGLTVYWKSSTFAQQEANASPIASPMAGEISEASPEAATPVADAPAGPPTALDAYLRIEEDGTATLLTGKVEFGQGIATGFVQLVAEELSLPFESVNVVMGQTDIAPFDLGTFGSLSTRFTGPRIRQAGAAMRIWLIELGSSALGLAPEEVQLSAGTVVSTTDPSKSVTFAELASGKQSARELDPEVVLKDPSTYNVIGQSIPRPDVSEKVNGRAQYGIDSAVEGMVWGKIVRPPGFGFTLESIDFSAAEQMPGVVGTYQDGDFAGLAAETLAQAEAALSAVKATWIDPGSTVTHETIFDYMLETASEPSFIGDDTGPGQEQDLTSSLTDPINLTYRAPYIVHTPIEPRNALVSISDDRVEVWCSTQDPWTVRSAVAEITGRDVLSVIVTPMAAGGAFGSKVLPMAESEAARLAVAFDRPVKLLWRRDEEIAHGQYRPAMMINIVAGLDAESLVAGWQYSLYSTSYFPEGTDQENPAAADWSADAGEIYEFGAIKTQWQQSQSPLPPYYWRVNGATTNTWARESTLDILAEKSGMDPVSFRRPMLANNPRMAAVMDAVVEKAGWTPGVGSTGQGVGIALGFDANTFVAEVARVSVDVESGVINVEHVDVAVDCGLIINPEAVKHQVEGSVVMGTSATLREIVQFENGKVTNPTFAQYAPITMREAPSVDVVFVEDKTNPMGGIGEPAVAPSTAAIANAVYDLTGVRLFDTPFTADRVLAAIKERDAAATPVS